MQEVIFVGLPGPTHHYGGLSDDNVAATSNRGSQSSPKEAALQALELVRMLRGLGLKVGVLPPQLRPHMPLLRQHFEGENDSIIRQAGLQAPALLEKASSSSAMWTANAATVAPSADTADSKLHLTVANLFSNLHRRIEAEDTFRVLAGIFAQVPGCVVHPRRFRPPRACTMKAPPTTCALHRSMAHWGCTYLYMALMAAAATRHRRGRRFPPRRRWRSSTHCPRALRCLYGRTPM